MKTPTAPGTGRQGFQVVNSDSSNNSTTAAPPPSQHTASPVGRDGETLIAVLADLFPSTFVVDRWKPHRPLKVGIHRDLIGRGLLLPDECRAVPRWYCARLMYRRAVAGGGPRYGLAGEPAGEVTPEQMAGGKSRVAAIEARRALKAKAIAVGSRRGAARAPGNRPVEHRANPQRRNDPTLKADWARGRQHSRARNCEIFR
jgi:sRNA-binding protein